MFGDPFCDLVDVFAAAAAAADAVGELPFVVLLLGWRWRWCPARRRKCQKNRFQDLLGGPG